MKQSQRILFDALQSGLWGKDFEFPKEFKEWYEVLRYAKEQSTLCLVGDVLLRNQVCLANIPELMKQKIRKFAATNIYTHNIVNNVLAKVVLELIKYGIYPVLLKGQSIALHYPVPELRQCGDIDLYVGQDNYMKAYEVLTAYVDDVKEPFESLYKHRHFTLNVEGIDVEIHRLSGMMMNRNLDVIYQNYSDQGLSTNLVRIQLNGSYYETPADNFNALYIFKHLFDHFLSTGVGLRQCCDLAIFLHKRKKYIDCDVLESMLNNLSLMDPWQVFGCILVDYIGLQKSDFPLYKKCEGKRVRRVVDIILSDGNFGQSRSELKNTTPYYIINKLQSLVGHTLRSSKVFGVFPRYAATKYLSLVRNGIMKVLSDYNR